ncbi:MAG: cyclic nucleotide-binding and patatin-like phospholipase domain-containing protein [Byssovorax sp.]
MTPDDACRLLSSFPLFSSLPAEATADLANRLTTREVRCGEALMRQGEEGRSLFLILDGRFEARAEQPSGPARAIGVLGRGETVGEMAVITAEPRSCTVVAARRSSVLELSGDDFLRVLQSYPAALLSLTRRIVKRGSQPMGSSPVRRVAILPLHQGSGASWLAKRLARALARFGPAVRLGRDRAIAELGELPAGATVPRLSPRFLEWLAEQERAHELVVYEALPAIGEWTHRCLAQADLVLLVAEAGGPPAPTALERELLDPEDAVTLAPVHLVLLRPDRASRPAGTAPWLDARSVALHHHVAIGDDADVERLARIVAGRAVELVLSGGGARGLAEIGVLRAFEEAGLPVDLVGGTSMGSAIGGFCAMRLGADEMLARARRFCRGSVKDPTFPFLSIYAARNGSRAAREIYEGWSIEDLPLPFFAVATDLFRAEEVIQRRGPLWAAIRASASIPGAFPPVAIDGRCLVDGGVLNNLPIDVMARLCPGRIAAVSTSREVALDPDAIRMLGEITDGSTSGWRLLWQSLWPWKKRRARTLHIADVLARSSEIAAVRIGRNIRAETPLGLFIEPPLDEFRMLDFASIDAIVEAGYRFAAEHVEAWKRALLDP